MPLATATRRFSFSGSRTTLWAKPLFLLFDVHRRQQSCFLTEEFPKRVKGRPRVV
jgi:hypothetical protein